MKDRLGGAPEIRRGGFAVKPVLEDVEVDSAQVVFTEFMDVADGRVEPVGFAVIIVVALSERFA